MRCNLCGNKNLKNEDKFCSKCGKKLSNDTENKFESLELDNVKQELCNAATVIDSFKQESIEQQSNDIDIFNDKNKIVESEGEDTEYSDTPKLSMITKEKVERRFNYNSSPKVKRIIKYFICIFFIVILFFLHLYKINFKYTECIVIGNWNGTDKVGNKVSLIFEKNKDFKIDGLGFNKIGKYEVTKDGNITLMLPKGEFNDSYKSSTNIKYKITNKNTIIVKDKNGSRIRLTRNNHSADSASSKNNLDKQAADNISKETQDTNTNSGGNKNIIQDKSGVETTRNQSKEQKLKEYLIKKQECLTDGRQITYLTNISQNVYVYIITDEGGLDYGYGESAIGIVSISNQSIKELYASEIDTHVNGFLLDINKVKDCDKPNIFICLANTHSSREVTVFILNGDKIETSTCSGDEEGFYGDLKYMYIVENIQQKVQNGLHYNKYDDSAYNDNNNLLKVNMSQNGQSALSFKF